jgi:coproporphyrinogen III oxidase-like Fe-S oxidoreductase
MMLQQVKLNFLNKGNAMYKRLLIFSMALIMMGCSTTSKERISEKSLNKHEPKTTSELKQLMNKMLDEHKELDEEKRAKVKIILENGLDRSYFLKRKESQIVQVYFEDVLVKDVPEQELKDVKKEIKIIYAEKVENFLKTFDEVNTVLGRSKQNVPIANDLFYNSMELR